MHKLQMQQQVIHICRSRHVKEVEWNREVLHMHAYKRQPKMYVVLYSNLDLKSLLRVTQTYIYTRIYKLFQSYFMRKSCK